MTDRTGSLTAKEKETLRLLLAGHDAKSMARHLGLSVHTVNERLRDARRKLSVSSSREAARVLRAAEGATPDCIGDMALRGAPIPAMPAASSHQTVRSGRFRRHGWLIGGTAMTITLALAALAALSGTDAPVTPPAASAPSAAETAAVDAARRWLALLDSGDWEGSWQATGASFRALNTSVTWAQVSQKVRAPLGPMRSRMLSQVNYAPAPPHGYWVIRFSTTYANKASAIETVSLAAEDGNWKVAGITID